MSTQETFILAHQARGKLSREAAQSDHDLRLLVGHANLLDRLMLHLSEIERDQARWYQSSISSMEEEDEEVERLEALMEEEEDENSDVESEDGDLQDFTLIASPRIGEQRAEAHADEELFEEEDDDEEEDEEGLFQLTRTVSRRPDQVPALDFDDSDSEDEPSSPPQPSLPSPRIATVDLKVKKQLATTSYYEQSDWISEHSTAIRAY